MFVKLQETTPQLGRQESLLHKEKATPESERWKPTYLIATTGAKCARKFTNKMKHAKCMILVPEDTFARFEQKQKLETSPLVNNMMQKDTEMSDILQRKDIEDDEKQKLYYANLERYMNIMQQKSK